MVCLRDPQGGLCMARVKLWWIVFVATVGMFAVAAAAVVVAVVFVAALEAVLPPVC